MLKLTEGQGQKVKGQGQICNFTKKMLFIHMIGFNATLKVTQGQGLKVKGQV